MDKVGLAENLHLTDQAITLLQEGDVSKLDPVGALKLLQLLLSTGQHERVAEYLRASPQLADKLNAKIPLSYNDISYRLHAIQGNYLAADQHLEEMIETIKARANDATRAATARYVGLAGWPHAGRSFTESFDGQVLLMGNILNAMHTLRALQLNLMLVRGFLALESGGTEKAARLLREVQGFKLAGARFRAQDFAAYYLRLIERQ
jgi:hypothetical protein